MSKEIITPRTHPNAKVYKDGVLVEKVLVCFLQGDGTYACECHVTDTNGELVIIDKGDRRDFVVNTILGCEVQF